MFFPRFANGDPAFANTGRDGTVYGANPTSTTSFKAHHLSEISTAIVCADAESILNSAAAASFASLLPRRHAAAVP